MRLLLSTVGRCESQMAIIVISPECDMLMLGEFEPSGDFDVVRIAPALWLLARLPDAPLVFSFCSSSS